MLYEGTFPTGMVELHYVAAAEVGPPILFLHGATSRWQSSIQVMPAFALRWQLYALDFRGHGRSGRAAGANRAVDYAADVVAFLRQRVARPAVLVGHSLGAIVATAVAADAPELVRAAVLEDPPLGPFSDQSYRESSSYSPFTATYDLVRQQLSLAELTQRLAETTPRPEWRRSRALTLAQLDPEALATILDNRAKEGYGLEERLRRIAAPVLLLQGNAVLGGALDDVQALRAVALLRDCTHVQFPEAGHGLKDDRPVEYCRVVNAFLESL